MTAHAELGLNYPDLYHSHQAQDMAALFRMLQSTYPESAWLYVSIAIHDVTARYTYG